MLIAWAVVPVWFVVVAAFGAVLVCSRGFAIRLWSEWELSVASQFSCSQSLVVSVAVKPLLVVVVAAVKPLGFNSN